MTSEQRQAVRTHIDGCPSCREEVATIQAIGSLLRKRGPAALPAVTPAPDLWSRIEAQMDAEAETAPAPTPAFPSLAGRPYRNAIVFAPAFAAVVLAAVVIGPHLVSQNLTENTPRAGAVSLTSPTTAAEIAEQEKSKLDLATANVGGTVSESDAAYVGSPIVRAPHRQVRMVASAAPSSQRERSTSNHIGASPSASTRLLLDAARSQAQEAKTANSFDAKPYAYKNPARHDPFAPIRNTSLAHYSELSVSRKATPTPDPITIVTIASSPTAPAMSAIPHPVAPPVPGTMVASALTRPATTGHNIDVVFTDTTGITDYANTPPPAEQLNRQRQRRSLFGGYSVAVPTAALAPTGILKGGSGGSAPATSPW